MLCYNRNTMAALKPRQTDGDSIELVTSLSGHLRGVGTIQFILFFVLFSALSDNSDTDLVGIVGFLFALSMLPVLFNLLTSTTVRIDARQRQISKARSVLFLTFSGETLSFNDVAKIQSQPTSAARRARTSQVRWQLLAVRAQGTSMVLNTDGAPDEMQAQGKQIAEMVGCDYEARDITDATLTRMGQIMREASGAGQPASPELPPVAPNVLMPDAPSEEHKDFERESGLPPASERPVAPNVLMPDAPSEEHKDFEQSMPSGDDTLAEEEKRVPPNTLLPDSPSPEHAQFEADAGTSAESSVSAASDFAPPPPPQYAQMSQSDLEQTVRDDATQSDAWLELARRYDMARRWNDMANALRQVMRYDPMNAGAQNDLGVALYYTNALDDAEAAFNRAMALDLFNIAPRINLVIALRRHGRGKQADTVLADAQQYANDTSSQRLLDTFRRGVIREPLRANG